MPLYERHICILLASTFSDEHGALHVKMTNLRELGERSVFANTAYFLEVARDSYSASLIISLDYEHATSLFELSARIYDNLWEDLHVNNDK